MAEDQEQDIQDRVTGSVDLAQYMIQRERIKQLYLVDGLTRGQTRFVMNDRYQFDASDRQYKYLIEKKWQLQKTLTLEDKKFVILKTLQQQQQHGLPTKFLLCGREIDNGKLSRQRKAIIAAKDAHQDLGPTPRNLIYYTPDTSGAPLLPSSVSRTLAIGKSHDRVVDKPFCIICIICEHDIYGFNQTILEDFESHLDKEHTASLPATSVLAFCLRQPKSLSDCLAHDRLYEWNFGGNRNVLRNPDAIIGPFTVINVLLENPSCILWITDASDPCNLMSLGILTKSSDSTPPSFFLKPGTQSLSKEGVQTESKESLIVAAMSKTTTKDYTVDMNLSRSPSLLPKDHLCLLDTASESQIASLGDKS